MISMIPLARRSVVALLSAALIAGCGEAEPPLAVSAAPTSPALHPIMQALRARQLLTWVNDQTGETTSIPTLPASVGNLVPNGNPLYAAPPLDAGYNDLPTQTFLSVDGGMAINVTRSFLGLPTVVFDVLTYECAHRRWLTEHPDFQGTITGSELSFCENIENSAPSCSQVYCTVADYACAVNLLNELASAVRPVQLHHWRNTPPTPTYEGLVTFPVQTPVTRAALREAALFFSSYSLSQTEVWNSTAIVSSDGLTDCDTRVSVGGASITQGELAGNAIREMLELTEEAGFSAANAYVAVADSERSRHASLADANETSRVIRAYATNLLAGMHATTEVGGGTCASPPLSESGEAALGVLRSVGLPASVYQSTQTTASIVAGSSGGVDAGIAIDPQLNVKFRYARVSGRSTEIDAMSTAAFLRDLNLTMGDFDEARKHIVEEITTFGRSTGPNDYLDSQKIPDPEIAFDPDGGVVPDSGVVTDRHLYVATATAPSATPWAHYAAPVSVSSDYDVLFHGIHGSIRESLGSLDTYAGMTLDATADFGANHPGIADLRAQLSAVQTTERLRIEGHIGYSVESRLPAAGTPATRVFVASDSPAANLVLTTTISGVRCAENGTIEGRDCVWAEVGAVAQSSPAVAATSASGTRALFTEYLNDPANVLGNANLATRVSGITFPYGALWSVPASSGRTVYVMRLKTGGSPNQPGDYETFAVLRVAYAPSTFDFGLPGWSAVDWRPSGLYPIAPGLQRTAAQFLAPSEQWCSAPAIECDGRPYGQEIPLEDELTEDGSATENSWQIYLRRAREAAERADRLGEETLDRAFDIEQRAESAVQELQEICGVEIDIDPFASASNHGETDPVDALLAGTGALGAIDETRRTQLHRCLANDESTIVPAALGNDSLCAWKVDNELCALPENTTTAPACPYVVPVPSGMTLPATDCDRFAGDGVTPVVVSHVLGLLPPVDPGQQTLSTNAAPGLCANLRNVRGILEGDTANEGFAAADQRATAAAWASAFADSFFTPQALANAARAIQWRAEAGNYSTIRIGDRVSLSTGSTLNGPSSVGICAPAGPFQRLDCDGPWGGLYCLQEDCAGNPYTRAALNARLAAAATVARWLGGQSLGGFVVPDTDAMVSSKTVRSLVDPDDDTGLANMRRADLAHGSWHAGSPTHYCFDSDVYVAPAPGASFTSSPTDRQNIWYFAHGSGTGWGFDYPQQYNGTCIHGQSIRFSELADGYWGHKSVSGTNQTYHLRRMEALLGRLPGAVYAPASLLMPEGLALGVDGPGRAGLYGLYRHEGNANALRRTGFVNSDVPDGSSALNGANLPWFSAQDESTTGDAHTHPGVASYFASKSEFSRTTYMDALELLCEAGSGSPDPVFLSGVISGKDAARDASERLAEFARTWQAILSTLVLEDVPLDVVDTMQAQQTQTSGLGGRYGAQVLRFSGAVRGLAIQAGRFQQSIEATQHSFDTLGQKLVINSAQEELQNQEMVSTMSAQVARCGLAVAAASSPKGILDGDVNGAMITCADSLVQISIAVRRNATQGRISNAEERLAYIEFETALTGAANQIKEAAIAFRSSRDDLQASLEELSVIRDTGRRALARALFLDEVATGAAFRTNTVARSRLRVAQQRYDRARTDAIEAAFTAKRAIEQRFGVRMSTMNDNMRLVDAPAAWESTICTMDGIDYAAHREPNSNPGEEPVESQYIGDYVTLLEQFVESYRYDYPFQNGEATAVISLRDDVANVRAVCDAPVDNRLYHSANLAMRAEASGTGIGWQATGCDVGVDGEVDPYCVSIDESRCDMGTITTTVMGETTSSKGCVDSNLLRTTLEITSIEPAARTFLGAPKPFAVRFGGPLPSGCPGASCECADQSDCGWAPGVRLSQDLPLGLGTHRISWYGPTVGGSSYVEMTVAGITTTYANALAGRKGSDVALGGWTRYWFLVDATRDSVATFAFRPPTETFGSQILVAGPMVESLGSLVPSAGGPLTFSATGETLTHSSPVCEDTDGRVFRDRAWSRHCAQLCDTGFQTACTTANAYAEQCYWETEFTISERAILRGEMLAHAGFALGNFNYRIDSIGVNFVGSATRQCADDDLPSTCYSAGFLQYSLEQQGPHRFRNYEGTVVEAALFPGRIEQAMGLAAERYITNPISSADRSMIEPYMQRQLRGRPISGQYMLRVWETPGVNFAGVEDVQILLNYRFWTRSL